MKQISLEDTMRSILPPLQETGWASEDLNLAIDDRRKVIQTIINKHRIRFTLRMEPI